MQNNCVSASAFNLAIADIPPCEFDRRQRVVAGLFQHVRRIINARRRERALSISA